MAEQPKNKQINARAAAANILYQVVDQGQSLSQMLPRVLPQVVARDHALVKELCFGVLRWLPRFEAVLQQLMDKPLKGKIRNGHFLLMVGLYQLFYMRVPAHAAVSETVSATSQLKLHSLKKLVNGVLRNAERQREQLEPQLTANDSLKYCHPSWISKRLKAAYPEQWAQILEANNQHAPMWIRVNALQGERDTYQTELAALEIASQSSTLAQQALCLDKAQPVHKLPRFTEGASSVQDGAAQMAASLLDAQPGERVLDACSAPGGKTCHILELQPALAELVAVDTEQARLNRVTENLERIGLKATLHCNDASKPERWNDQPFDRILLDAPCSATGVIRRHPDIKWLRRDSDIAELVKLQKEILEALWQQLKPGGVMLYATCSVLPDENSQQIAAFLQQTADAELVPINQDETATQPGWQLLPGNNNMDGFYYARLRKTLP
ncbi:16S rRNA (cytosine(967)-C(5))-methyltransferase RsmB [Agarivorans albus]|uniref:16S rRNA (cytosine(967)-C(5))-methyltransferase n=1 Tax=Agarivorans albus MKT 106 TaxID=1331007 RepID=R9PPS4_AGAAL|nr:16S rRNA (cytosine(967)-C(5))-methyltransferase RsmB [Agarivorans albus]GAD00136.1 ribosomal RNA small subunit methyltransferase B [Agarivorans albus MKT 106]